MGDRICIKLTDGNRTTPVFYGHWCGLRGLEAMIETLHEPCRDIGTVMCNFIVKVMDGTVSDYSYYLMNDGEADGIADWDWGSWTCDVRSMTWTTTSRIPGKNTLRESEVLDFIEACKHPSPQ